MTGKAIVVVMVKVVLIDMGIEMRATTVCVLYTKWCQLILPFQSPFNMPEKMVTIPIMVSM